MRGDQHLGGMSTVSVEVWIDGSSDHQTVSVDPDRGIVAYDNPFEPDRQGVDIFETVQDSNKLRYSGVDSGPASVYM
ncbi:unnamed protein product [Calypogeia fissa]